MREIYKASEAEKLAELTGPEVWRRQRSSRHVCIPVDHGYFLAFCWCDIREAKKEERLCFYCGEQGWAYAGESAQCAKILRALPEEDNPFSELAEFFSELTAEDVDELERLENTINELEMNVLTTKKPIDHCSSRIAELRRLLLRLKRYYEQMGIVIDQLTENENGSLPESALSRFRYLSRRIRYLTQSVVDLREYVTQVRETYQAKIDMEQNQIMKVFTVITAVFLPLTLIAGWYGMNFHIPELEWEYGYCYVIVLSIVVCGVCFWFFKKKRWF